MMPSTWRSTRDCWPSLLRRKAQSAGFVHEEVFGEDGRATKMGSCGFMGPKVVFACAEPLPELLSPGT